MSMLGQSVASQGVSQSAEDARIHRNLKPKTERSHTAGHQPPAWRLQPVTRQSQRFHMSFVDSSIAWWREISASKGN
jgi:hypothetical protein